MTGPDRPPRTHRWVRRARPQQPALEPRALAAEVPDGVPPEGLLLADRCREALAGWPIVVLRIVVHIEGRADLGRHPARWIRRELLEAADRGLCSCPGTRCTRPDCRSNRLFGRHGRGHVADGEAWAPFAVRAAESTQGRIEERGALKFELVLAGERAVGELPGLVETLSVPREATPGSSGLVWAAIHALRQEEDGELAWRRVDPSAPPPLLAIDRLTAPTIRPSRLTLTFLTATPMGRQKERGQPTPDLGLVIDRLTRSLGAWMGRTGHKGPRLPVEDLLRAAGAASLKADHSRIVELPGLLLGASGSRDEEDAKTPSLLGSITWTGDFVGLGPVLRAAHYLGMGPGRQHGLGQVAVR